MSSETMSTNLPASMSLLTKGKKTKPKKKGS